MSLTKTTHAVMVLKGREFAEPAEPKELRRHTTMLRDRGDAGQLGRGQAHDFEMTNAGGGLHIDDKIDADVASLIADQRHEYAKRIESADGVGRDASEQEADALRELAELHEVDDRLAAVQEQLGDRHGPGPIGYGFLLITVFLLNLPLDVGAAQLLPLPRTMQALLAVLLGAGTTWMAHYAARKIEDLRDAQSRKDDDGFGYLQERILLVVALVVPLLVIIGTTIWRGQAFASAEKATGGLVQGGAANLAFAAIALLAFAVAVIAGLAHRRMMPVRKVRAERAKNAAKRRSQQNICDKAERLQRQAELTIAFLEERLERRIERVRQWGAKRKATIRQRASTVEMKKRLKDPDAADRLLRTERTQATAPTSRRGTLRPVDLEAVARDVQQRANGTSQGTDG